MLIEYDSDKREKTLSDRGLDFAMRLLFGRVNTSQKLMIVLIIVKKGLLVLDLLKARW